MLHEVDFTELNICECGAITVIIEGKQYSMTSETFEKRYGIEIGLSLYYNCNHCVNHWGIDICACGSGEKPNECDEEFDVCGLPMQDIDEQITRR